MSRHSPSAPTFYSLHETPYEVFNYRGPSPLPPPQPPGHPRTPTMAESTPMNPTPYQSSTMHSNPPTYPTYSHTYNVRYVRRPRSKAVVNCCLCLGALGCCCCVLIIGAAIAAFFLFPRIPDVDADGIHDVHLALAPLSLVFTESYLVTNHNYVKVKLSHTDYNVFYQETFVGTSKDNTTWTFDPKTSGQPYNITVRISNVPLSVAGSIVDACANKGDFTLHFKGKSQLKWLLIDTDVPTEFDQSTLKPMRKFQLGEQPDWAGQEPAVPKDVSFIRELLEEGPAFSLANRGYAIVELSEPVTATYSTFHRSFELFCKDDRKEDFAFQQFDPKTFAPNQYHGYSRVHGLKEQFMMRICGSGCEHLEYPEITTDSPGLDFGIAGVRLFEYLDQLCRDMAGSALIHLGRSVNVLDRILDPVGELGADIEREETRIYSRYVPPGYVSSSIMDNFYYFNTFEEAHADVCMSTGDAKVKQFHNNHSAHTDSGLLTVVVATDQPGLEVLDQTLGEWVALERLLHEFARLTGRGENPHRRYATIFWGDSVQYLGKNSDTSPLLTPSMHRVARAGGERYSVVFKQRTCPLSTAPRYQEDYELAAVQLRARDSCKGLDNHASTSSWAVLPTPYFILFIVIYMATYMLW